MPSAVLTPEMVEWSQVYSDVFAASLENIRRQKLPLPEPLLWRVLELNLGLLEAVREPGDPDFGVLNLWLDKVYAARSILNLN